MLVIGLVGGIASGKSFVAQCFAQLGAEVLDADQIGHGVLDLPEVISAIKTHWPAVGLKGGKIDRRSLAAIVFGSGARNSADDLNALESITHPKIGTRIQQQLALFQTQNVVATVLDAPVMLKAGWQEMCDKIVFVESSLEDRQSRAALRGWDDQQLERRESFQETIDQKRSVATDVVDNSGTRQQTRQQVEALWRKWGLPDPSVEPPTNPES